MVNTSIGHSVQRALIPLYTHSLPLIFVEQIFSFEGSRPENSLKIEPLSKKRTNLLIYHILVDTLGLGILGFTSMLRQG